MAPSRNSTQPSAMASSQSPGLNMTHGFIHYVRRHQLEQAQLGRKAVPLAERLSRVEAVGKTLQKQKRPDAPLYSPGTPYFQQCFH